MEFKFDTKYDAKALTSMARALRKTVRKKRSRRTHIWGWIVIVLGLLVSLPLGEREITMSSVVTWVALAVMLAVFLFEDRLNGKIAGKRMLAGTERTETVFTEERYTSVSALGKSEWNYGNIKVVAENAGYFVFLFSENHAQVYDKSTISGGTVEEFREFIAEKTGAGVVRLKK